MIRGMTLSIVIEMQVEEKVKHKRPSGRGRLVPKRSGDALSKGRFPTGVSRPREEQRGSKGKGGAGDVEGAIFQCRGSAAQTWRSNCVRGDMYGLREVETGSSDEKRGKKR